MSGYIGDKFTERLKTDYLVFDGKQAVEYRRIYTVPDGKRFDDKGNLTDTDIQIKIEDALVREVTRRIQHSLKQLFDKYRSTNINDINLGDIIVEIPFVQFIHPMTLEQLTPKQGDIIIADVSTSENSKWTVLAFDHSTILSRWRIIARSL